MTSESEYSFVRSIDCYAITYLLSDSHLEHGISHMSKRRFKHCQISMVVQRRFPNPLINIHRLMPDPFPYGFFSAYLNTEKVLSAFGAATNYTDSSAAISDAFGTTGDDGREDGTIEDVLQLLKQGITVMLYFGDADYNCNW